MELQTIPSSGAWSDIATVHNANNTKINTEVIKLNKATIKQKGLFTTLTSLQSTYSTAVVGDMAYVGTSFPAAVYRYNGSSWVATGDTGGDESVTLTDYITTATMSDNFSQIL